MNYLISLKKTDEGYAVWCPGLPGCWSQGMTEEEAVQNIKEAIQLYLETAQKIALKEDARILEIAV